jgi:hypothetical protein
MRIAAIDATGAGSVRRCIAGELTGDRPREKH